MNNLTIFENENFGTVRVIEVNNKPYFVGVDIARALGYARPNNAINTHCKGTLKQGIPTNGGNQEVAVISEGDIYRLIMKSKLPAAEKFESWVMDEVLPQIRQTGGYIKVEQEDTPEEIMARALMVAQKTLDRKNELLRIKDYNLKAQKAIIEDYKPKVEKYNDFLEADGLFKVTNIADMFGLTARKLNKILAELGIQYKQGYEWALYARFKDKGYAQGVATTIYHSNGDAESKYTLKWTSRGIDFIASKLQSIGIYPVISNHVQQLSFN